MRHRADDAVGFHDQNAAEFEQKYANSPDFRERVATWRPLLDRYVPPGATVIDAGCGPGGVALYLAERGHTVTGIDGAPAMVARCTEKAAASGLAGRAQFRLGTLPAALDDISAPVDAVVMSSVLEYLPDLDATMDAVFRRLKPGGLWFVSVPNASSLYRKVERQAFRWLGRPKYLAHVRQTHRAADFDAAANAHHLFRVDIAYYAGADRISRAFAWLPEARHFNLFVAVYQKAR